MENTTQDFSGQPASAKKSKLPVIIIAVVVIAAAAAGILLLSRNKSSKPPEVAGTTTVAPSPSPTPTPAPAVDKQSVKIQVLNGTSTPGQATKVAVSLKNAGYNLDNIKTGNAPDNAASSSIAAKTGFEATAADIKATLIGDFPDISVNTSPLDAGSDFDVVITTGGKAYQAPTATPTPTGSATPTPTPGGTTDTPTPTPTTTEILTPTPTP